MKEIDKVKPNGYDGDKAVSELIEYVGMRQFGEYMGVVLTDEEWKEFKDAKIQKE
jgi:hypothetical protein